MNIKHAPAVGEVLDVPGGPATVRLTIVHPNGAITCKLSRTKKPARRSWLARLFSK